ncbi:MAG: hypothetical protein AAGU77_12340, partial [Bacillota bacterium]
MAGGTSMPVLTRDGRRANTRMLLRQPLLLGTIILIFVFLFLFVMLPMINLVKLGFMDGDSYSTVKLMEVLTNRNYWRT